MAEDVRVGCEPSEVVAEIRAALGDPPRAARFIRTVSRFGYAFHGDAREEPRADAPAKDRRRRVHALCRGGVSGFFPKARRSWAAIAKARAGVSPAS